MFIVQRCVIIRLDLCRGWTIMGSINENIYYIKEVSDLIGISEQLIRKWESRYNIVQPERLANGYRIYNHDDVLTLKKLKELRDQGYSLKKAKNIIAKKGISNQFKDELDTSIEASPYVSKLIEAGAIYDEENLILLLKQANQQYGLDLFLKNTVQPFLRKVGSLWKSKKWDESQETISSLVVRDFLTELSRSFPINVDAPVVLGFCLPNERHEIPLQILLLQLEIRGWRTIRVAPSPKFSAIEQLIKRIKPEKVLLSGSTIQPFQKDVNLLNNLDKLAKKYNDISFYIGGTGVWKYTEIIKPKYMNVAYSLKDILN